MKKTVQWGVYSAVLACFLTMGCNKSDSDVWDENQASLKKGHSFWNDGNERLAKEGFVGPADEDFIPLQEDDLRTQFADAAIPQPKSAPGEPGSGLPGIEFFHKAIADLAFVFQNIQFNTDDHIVRGAEQLNIVEKIAAYLKSHTNTYVYIEGHTDERGPEAYNLSLGTRRANSVRSLLVQKGVDLNQVHTISYGKERPSDHSHTPDAWTRNRRAEFKIYQKPS